MISFFEVIKRALNGSYYSEQDFAMKVVVPKLRELVAKYDIRYDPENPVPSDDKLADDVWQAGLELSIHTGAYCTDTSRVIKFSEEEILEGLRDAPSAPVFGEGSDEKVMVARQPESTVMSARWEADPVAAVTGEVSVSGRPDALPGDNRVFFSLPPVR